MGSVTHSAKFTLPSPFVSNRLQASRVLLPLTLISSQFHVTWRVNGRPELSMQSWVRSFCPGSSLAPAVSLTQLSAARTDVEAITATPNASTDAIIMSIMVRKDNFTDALDSFFELLSFIVCSSIRSFIVKISTLCCYETHYNLSPESNRNAR